MERRKRVMFCSLAAMVLATALSSAVNRPFPGTTPAPLRLSAPVPSPWVA